MTKLMGIEEGVPTGVLTFLEGKGGVTASYYNILRRVRTYHPVGFEHTTLSPLAFGDICFLCPVCNHLLCAPIGAGYGEGHHG